MRYSLLLLFSLLVSVAYAGPEQDIVPDNYRTDVRVTPINSAEAILEPFWDPTLSGLSEWQVKTDSVSGLRVWQNWCWAAFEWLRQPEQSPALEMSRPMGVDVQSYDRLIVSVVPPEEAVVGIRAVTDVGIQRVETEPVSESSMKEIGLDLNGATRLDTLTLWVHSASPGTQHGWFNWIGLQNTHRLDDHLAQWSHFDSTWAGYLKPDSIELRYEPATELLFGPQDLDRLRAAVPSMTGPGGILDVREIGRLKNRPPEPYIGEYVSRDNWRWNRVRDHDRLLTYRPGYGYQLALAGVLMQDQQALRMAARYALSIASCEHWKEGMTENFPGSIWNHRAFAQSLYAYECAVILDLADDCFTWLGKEYILRRIVEKAMSAIDYSTWKYEYIHHTNQMCYFSQGRMAGALSLESRWSRARSRVEETYSDLVASIKNVILPDGGYAEGPTYFQQIGGRGGLALYLYARSRGIPLAEAFPPILKKTTRFADVLESTDRSQDMIPICDARPVVGDNTLALMAVAMPNSGWTRIWHSKRSRTQGVPTSLLGWILMPRISGQTAPPPGPVSRLPVMGMLASTRYLEDQPVKILILGNHSGATHTHEDKGSFVLECAGETFAMDPGTCTYANPLSIVIKHAQRHNMLVPRGCPERPAPDNPIFSDIKPIGRGDQKQFQASMTLTPGWESYYKTWERHWRSPSPATLLITDRWDLKRGTGVAFLWNTSLPVMMREDRVEINGTRARVILQIPPTTTARLDTLPLEGNRNQYQIAFEQEGKTGEMTVRATLEMLQ
jgi:hypothetical protein